MAITTVIKEIELIENINDEELQKLVMTSLSESYDTFREFQHGRFEGRVKTSFFNPVVSLDGAVEVKSEGDKSIVKVSAVTKTNGWFWFTFALGFIPPFAGWFFLLIGWMWYSQKKSSLETLQSTIDLLDFELCEEDIEKVEKLNSHIESSEDPKENVEEVKDNIESIGKLHNLLKDGVITQDEFNDQKKKLIA